MNARATLSLAEVLRGSLTTGLLTLQDAEGLDAPTVAEARKATVKSYALHHIRDPALSVTSIAAALGLAPSTIHRAFEGEGETLGRWLWKTRLDGADRDLTDPRLAHRTVTDIAFSWGFNDSAHFSRAFRARFGLSPRAARRA